SCAFSTLYLYVFELMYLFCFHFFFFFFFFNDTATTEIYTLSLHDALPISCPWREWELTSRTRLMEFAEANQIPIARDKRGEAPFSVDANLLHSSSEGKILEDPAIEADEIVYQRTIRPEDAADKATVISVDFEHGDPTAIDGEK